MSIDPAMKKLMDKTKYDYYDPTEITTMFMEDYGPIKFFSIFSDSEYPMFCEAIVCLPREIVDIVKKEIQFVLLRLKDFTPEEVEQKEVENPACYIDLVNWLPTGKKAIIVLISKIFSGDHRRVILHEIAHHILRHYDYLSPEDKDRKETEVDKKVADWLNDREDG